MNRTGTLKGRGRLVGPGIDAGVLYCTVTCDTVTVNVAEYR